MRYLKASLLIGIAAAVFTALLFDFGAFHRLDQGLANFLGLRYSPVSGWFVQHLLIVLFAGGIAWTTVDIAKTSLKIVVAAGTLAEVLSAVWVFNAMGLFFSPFASILAIVGSFSGGMVYARSAAGGRKRVVRDIFADRISTRTFHTLVDSNTSLAFQGELREATVVVCEIFNHDHLAAALPVADYVALNNAFLKNAAEYLVEAGGYLDECDGESLRVVFGAPLLDARHAATACSAALALSTRLDAVNQECLRVWKQTFDFRIGINTGELVVAAYGSSRLGAFSVAGEPVEWARRLCSANLFYGSRILLGTTAYQHAEESVEVRPIELVQHHSEDRNREEVYELLGGKSTLSEEQLAKRDAFWKGVLFFRKEQWEEALAHFRAAFSPGRHDGPLEFYIRRVEQLRQGAPLLDWTTNRI